MEINSLIENVYGTQERSFATSVKSARTDMYATWIGHLIKKVVLLLMMEISMNANAGIIGGNTWKEEVLLHDGRRIIVERSQTYGGRHEIGQHPPIKDQAITFVMPDTGKSVTWEDKYSEDIGHSNFSLLALHILNGTSFIVTTPNLCLAYNKWGRPNPPYVIFKYDDKVWQHVQMSELPGEFKTINLLIDTYGHSDVEQKINSGLVSAVSIKELNSSIKQAEYQSILREPLKLGSLGMSCEELIYYKGVWISPGDSIGRRMMDRRNSK